MPWRKPSCAFNSTVGRRRSNYPDGWAAFERRYSGSSLPLRREEAYLGVAIRELPVAMWIVADNRDAHGNLGFDDSRIDPRHLRVLRLQMVKSTRCVFTGRW